MAYLDKETGLLMPGDNSSNQGGGSEGGGGIDTSDATASSADILNGKTAYSKGEKVTGKIQSQGAQSFTPGTSDQTIKAGVYLSGTQTIKGDSDLIASNIKSGVSIFNVSGSFTSDATAAASDIAKGKTAYVNGVKVTGTATGGGGETSFSYPFKGSLSGDAIASYIPAQGKRIHEWDVGMSEPESWSGNFEQSTLLGQDRKVLSFPVQSDDDYPDGKYCHWCNINVDIAKIVLRDAWSISCCFRFGDVWNTYNQAMVFGSFKYGGHLFSISRYVNEGLWVTVNGSSTNKRAATEGEWYYCRAEKKNNTVYCYLVDDPTEDEIAALNENSSYMIGSLPAPTTISDAYVNDVLFFGYNSTSDYRVFQLADLKITVD